MDETEKSDETGSQHKTKRAVAKTPVRRVGKRGKSALVEWEVDGYLQRGYVPVQAVRNNQVENVTLERAVPYGLPWEDFIEITATPQSIAEALRRKGVWRFEDLRIDRLISAAVAFDLAAFMQRAKKESGI